MFILGMMQMTSALFTQALNIFLICQLTDPADIVMNFVQFGFISQIDDLYARSLKNSFFMNLLRVSSIKINSTA